jgi:hypothetical protein
MGLLLILTISAFTLAIAMSASQSAKAAGPAKYFAIYYIATVSSGTSYLTVEGNPITVTGGTTGAFAYIPALNTTLLAGTSLSVSYAQSYYSVYTENDRLFLVERNVWGTNNEVANINETDLANGQSSRFQGFWFYEPNPWAVVGDGLYFVPGLCSTMVSSAFACGTLVFANLTTGAERQLLYPAVSVTFPYHEDPDNYGAMVSAGGNLFRYQFVSTKFAVGNTTYTCTNPQQGDCELLVNQIDLNTGKIARGADLSLPSGTYFNGTFSNWSFSANESAFYIAAMYSPNGSGTHPASFEQTASVWVWALPFTEFETGSIPNGPSNYWFDSVSAFVPIPSTQPASLTGIQASHDDLLLNMQGSLVLYTMPPSTCTTFQSCTGNSTEIPGSKPGAQLAYGATAPAQHATSTASTTTGAVSQSTAQSSSTSPTAPTATTSTSGTPTNCASSGGCPDYTLYAVAGVVAVVVIVASVFALRKRH